MRLLTRLLEPRATAHAHFDLPCGIYDPAQTRIEAESIKAICEEYPLHTLINQATKLAGASGTKGSAGPDVADTGRRTAGPGWRPRYGAVRPGVIPRVRIAS